ncbi:MAG: polysaccharide deacetylase family protein [Eubacteriales bacterium]|nr:polysaccharide deacetylase family protein [Eubacteriales bacterium]
MKYKQKILILFTLIFIININFFSIYASNTITENKPNVIHQFDENTQLKTNTEKVAHPLQSDFFGYNFKDQSPIFSVDCTNDETRKGKVAFSFDSAYINLYTIKLLDILDKYNIKSTFFMTEEWVESNPELVKEVSKRGHEIGNHSYKHPDFTKVSIDRCVQELTICHTAVYNTIGVNMNLFRFPYGSYSPTTVTIAKNMGYYPIQWSIDTLDWKDDSADAIMKRFNNQSKNLKEGAIILMHNGAKYTPDVLEQIIAKVYEKGLQVVKVSDLIYDKNFYVLNGVQYKFPNQ